MQVPESEVRFKEFDTGFTDGSLVKKILKDVAKSKKKKEAGEEYKTALQMLDEYNITMDQLKVVIKAESDAKQYKADKFVLSGNIRYTEDGKILRCYCRAGELMVKCIEDAYKDELNFTVPITGEYLFGKSWGDAH